jgi:replicative DNA helicase
VEARKPPIPMLADLRESGAIEQDADVVIFIYRDEVYDPETEKRGIADILVKKHRNGPTGDRQLVFLDKFAKFENLSDREVA